MKKRHFVSILVFILIIFTLVFINNNPQTQEVCIEDKKCFSVVLAETLEEKRIGLSQHDLLPEDEGMLFIYSEDILPGFWMRGMSFPIDIIWVDKNLEIVGVEKNLQPCENSNCEVFYPNQKIRYVLEINSGLSDRYEFERGDNVSIV